MTYGTTIYSTIIHLPPKQQREYARHIAYLHKNGFNTSVIQKSCLQASYGRAIVTIWRGAESTSPHRYKLEMMNVLDTIKAASYLVGRIVAKERVAQRDVQVVWPVGEVAG